jgi:hypothetical protein
MRFGRRHDLLGIFRDHAGDDRGGGRVALDDGCRSTIALQVNLVSQIETQRLGFWFARAGVGSVALVAILREDWLDVLVERNLGWQIHWLASGGPLRLRLGLRRWSGGTGDAGGRIATGEKRAEDEAGGSREGTEHHERERVET